MDEYQALNMFTSAVKSDILTQKSDSLLQSWMLDIIHKYFTFSIGWKKEIPFSAHQCSSAVLSVPPQN